MSEEMIVVHMDGVQRAKVAQKPMPFSFEGSVLNGGALDIGLVNALISLSLNEMFPEKQGSPFNWSLLKPNEAITYVATHDMINQIMNAGALKKGMPILPVLDNKVLERVKRTGMMTPKDIETKYAPSSSKPSL